MKVALLVADGGDGSASIRFFRDIELADRLAGGDEHCETYCWNEGYPTYIEVPDDFLPPGFWADEYYDGDS